VAAGIDNGDGRFALDLGARILARGHNLEHVICRQTRFTAHGLLSGFKVAQADLDLPSKAEAGRRG
jgi:hypothetical protein